MVWEAKRISFWIKDENDLPSRPHHLVIARNVLKPQEVKFFLSNAPESAPLEVLLLVAFSRWHIERLFEDSKTELGMDHFEARKYPAIMRHLVLTCISHLFLAEFWLAERGKKTGTDDLPSTNRDASLGFHLESRRTLLAETGRGHCRAIGDNAATKCRRQPFPPEADSASFAQERRIPLAHTAMPMAEMLAL
ncbi:MAG: hypothetical protein ACUVXJ_01500 [Phycisphaerae bacterium]